MAFDTLFDTDLPSGALYRGAVCRRKAPCGPEFAISPPYALGNPIAPQGA